MKTHGDACFETQWLAAAAASVFRDSFQSWTYGCSSCIIFLRILPGRAIASLWEEQGKRKEAQQLLGETYAWFTEGFDTADLREAASLLEELS